MNSPAALPVKVEVFDRDMMVLLSNHDAVSHADKARLRKYRHKAENGNQVRIVYEYGKEWKAIKKGRVTPLYGLGLTCFPRDIRAALAAKYYWDVDIANAQPNILLNLATRKGWECTHLRDYTLHRSEHLQTVQELFGWNREQAKDFCLATLFGCQEPLKMDGFFYNLALELDRIGSHILDDPEFADIRANCKKEKNLRGSITSVVAQTEELNILCCIDSLLKAKGRAFDVLIHDGGLVRKLPEESSFPTELLRELEAGVREKLGYSIRLEVKPLTHSFTDTPAVKIHPASTLINDKFAVTEFLKKHEGKVLYQDGQLFWKDDEGRWVQNDDAIRRTMVESNLVFHQEGAGGLKVIDYSGNADAIRRFMTMLPHCVPVESVPIQFEYQFVTEEPDAEGVAVFEELLGLLTNKNEEVKCFVRQYLAHMLQKPRELPGVSLIFTGVKGCGKDTLFDFLIRSVVGPMRGYNYNVTEQLFEKHDTGRMHTVLVKLEEADRKVCLPHSSELKSFITGKTQSFNPKNKPNINVLNMMRLIMTTNGPIPVDFSEEERRFNISNSSSERVGDGAFWKHVNTVFSRPGAARAVGEYLMSVDISKLSFIDFPIGEYQAAVVVEEKSAEEKWALQWVCEDWKTTSDFFDDYRAYCSINNLPCCRHTITLGKQLLKLSTRGIVERKVIHNQNYYRRLG